MSHQTIGPERAVLYTMPSLPSDVLRTMEFDQFFEGYHGAPFCVSTRDGWRWSSAGFRPPVATVVFRSRSKLDGVINDAGESTFGRFFLEGELDIQGDVSALLSVAEYVLRHSGQLSRTLVHTLVHASLELSRRLKTGIRGRGITNRSLIKESADLPVKFFEQWLGPTLGHFCARFESTEENLERAQRRSLDAVCDALELERDDRLLEIGCGWGSLLLHSAAQYKTNAQGTAWSAEQAEAINGRIRANDLQMRCHAEYRDLRAAPYPRASFDKIAEVGIFEQVDYRRLREHLVLMRRMLRPNGMLLLHRITRSPEVKPHKNASLYSDMFLEGELAPLSKELEASENAGLEVCSVQNIGRDYERTLRLWIQKLQRSVQNRGAFSSRGYRVWLLYLVDVAAAIQAGDLQIQQLLLRVPACQNQAAVQMRWAS
ncbi:MAG TPA: class I SAM-dependent methyltransferase [Silvibacterium sp.]|nr:class I SAM-dependent methyltransferase [Silvibacterium sp.]